MTFYYSSKKLLRLQLDKMRIEFNPLFRHKLFRNKNHKTNCYLRKSSQIKKVEKSMDKQKG